MMRRLEVINNTLAHNTKYLVPANANLINVLGLDGCTPVVPLKSTSASSPGGPMPGRSARK